MQACTSIFTSVALVMLLAGGATAQDDQPPAADPPAAAAGAPAAGAPAAGAPAAGAPAGAPAAAAAEPVPPPPATQGGALNAKCLSEIRSDTQWKEQLRNELRKIVGVPEVDPPGGGHQSVMRAACNDLLRTNLAFRDEVRETVLLPDVRAQLADVIRIDVHKADAQRMLRNKRHVVYTYSFLWVGMAGLIVFLWVRQRRLGEEVERLRRDLERAAND